jgi:hypothetical protein
VRRHLTSVRRLLLAAAIPTAGLAVARWLLGGGIDAMSGVQTWLFTATVFFVADACRPQSGRTRRVRLPIPFVISLSLLVTAMLVHHFTESTLSAWTAIGIFYALLLGFVSCSVSEDAPWYRTAVELSAAAIATTTPAAANQIITRFSSEEFLVIVECIILAFYWILLRFSYHTISKSSSNSVSNCISIPHYAATLSMVLSVIVLGWHTIRSYQQSFFPKTADVIQGISETSPFYCGISPSGRATYSAENVFQELLDRVAGNPENDATEFGMLALGTSDETWAELFRDSLLEEAEENLFINDDWSVKYGQYLAAQRVYYYARVRQAFPQLFDPAQDRRIREWFAAVNRRALTAGPVDLMYGLAFATWPQGPYENQETGAGLLSLLEANGLGDPSLTEENRQYLARNERGWSKGFRVTDDAAPYQPEWIENAWYQSLYSGQGNAENMDRSFEWLKLLAPPDGGPLAFNHRAVSPIADISWLAAVLTRNSDYVWLAGRALDSLQKTGGFLSAQPGAEVPLSGEAKSPTTGSCLLYGPSGVPTRAGPLAADKIVLRGGWEADDLYLLLNLRFSGWHRYKATNSVIQISQGGPLVVENVDRSASGWLPLGRRLFRDKRIPRENLNGLIIAKRGLSEVLYRLTGVEGPWAQDPPHFARVSRFNPGQDFDVSTSHIDDWHGWNHDRSILFFPAGVIVIIDETNGPQHQKGAIVWHFSGGYPSPNSRIQLRGKNEPNGPAEVMLLPLSNVKENFANIRAENRKDILRAQLDVSENGILEMATVFLTQKWVGAEVSVVDSVIEIRQENATILVPISRESDLR